MIPFKQKMFIAYHSKMGMSYNSGTKKKTFLFEINLFHDFFGGGISGDIHFKTHPNMIYITFSHPESSNNKGFFDAELRNLVRYLLFHVIS